MDKLVIGDKESIALRDKGRVDAWSAHFQEALGHQIKDSCPTGCNEYTCKGPEIATLHSKGIIWRCSRYLDTCECCGQDRDVDLPETDFKGNDIGFTMRTDRNPFDPEKAESGTL